MKKNKESRIEHTDTHVKLSTCSQKNKTIISSIWMNECEKKCDSKVKQTLITFKFFLSIYIPVIQWCCVLRVCEYIMMMMMMMDHYTESSSSSESKTTERNKQPKTRTQTISPSSSCVFFFIKCWWNFEEMNKEQKFFFSRAGISFAWCVYVCLIRVCSVYVCSAW